MGGEWAWAGGGLGEVILGLQKSCMNLCWLQQKILIERTSSSKLFVFFNTNTAVFDFEIYFVILKNWKLHNQKAIHNRSETNISVGSKCFLKTSWISREFLFLVRPGYYGMSEKLSWSCLLVAFVYIWGCGSRILWTPMWVIFYDSDAYYSLFYTSSTTHARKSISSNTNPHF